MHRLLAMLPLLAGFACSGEAPPQDQSTRISLNVATGWLPHFSPEFKSQYGERSEFVRAMADLFNLRLAETQESVDALPYPEQVLRLSDDMAVESIRDLLRIDQELLRVATQAACGLLELGELERAVDEKIGTGSFTAWLTAFERRDYDACQVALSGSR